MSSTFPTCAAHHCVMYQRWSGGINESPVWVCPMCESAQLPPGRVPADIAVTCDICGSNVGDWIKHAAWHQRPHLGRTTEVHDV